MRPGARRSWKAIPTKERRVRLHVRLDVKSQWAEMSFMASESSTVKQLACYPAGLLAGEDAKKTNQEWKWAFPSNSVVINNLWGF